MSAISSNAQEDLVILQQMEPIIQELWKPMRFLTDLRTIWIDLDDDERQMIEKSRPFRERFHERLAERHAVELLGTARRLQSKRYSDLRDELVQFLEYWDQQEPDKLKVLSAVIRTEIETVADPLP